MTEDKSPVFYEPMTDTMAIEIRPWPGGEGEKNGGEDAGPDLVIHYAPDGAPWLWEIESASRASRAYRRRPRRNAPPRRACGVSGDAPARRVSGSAHPERIC